MMVGLRREDALCHSKWSVGVNQIAAGLMSIWPPYLLETLPYFRHWSVIMCRQTLHSVQCLYILMLHLTDSAPCPMSLYSHVASDGLCTVSNVFIFSCCI